MNQGQEYDARSRREGLVGNSSNTPTVNTSSARLNVREISPKVSEKQQQQQPAPTKMVKKMISTKNSHESIESHPDYSRIVEDFGMQAQELKSSLDQVEKERGILSNFSCIETSCIDALHYFLR